MIWKLDEESYVDCCGIIIIHSFPDEYEEIYISDERYEYERYEIFDDLDKSEQDSLKKKLSLEIDRIVNYFDNKSKGMFQIVLNLWQNRKFSSLIRKHGFRMKQKFFNPNTENTIFLYTLLVKQPRKIKSRVKRVFKG